jgi:hypothetical protein
MVVLWLLAGGIVLLLIYGALLNGFPKKEVYEIVTEKVSDDFFIVLLTDLHECEHGRDNEKLLRQIRECSPDFICIAGDLTVKDGKHTDRVLSFLERLSSEYEVFYAPGNHEIRMPDYQTYKEKVKGMNIHYLEDKSVSWNHQVTVSGLDMPLDWYHKCWKKTVVSSDDIKGHLGDKTGDDFRILLSHNPEYFSAYAGWGADLTLSGHVHGGILRLPFVGGVIAPSLRLFPKYDAGEFHLEDKKMIVSRGLGLHHIKFRFFNSPEISVIHIKNKTRRQA